MGKCACCGKELPQKKGRGRPKKFCSKRCKQLAYRAIEKEKSVFIAEEDPANYPKYQLEDSTLYWQNSEFNQNDNNWGLGESNLTEHAAGDKNLEYYYIKKELKRIFSRKPNP